jgi:hypothetical protein
VGTDPLYSPEVKYTPSIALELLPFLNADIMGIWCQQERTMYDVEIGIVHFNRVQSGSKVVRFPYSACKTTSRLDKADQPDEGQASPTVDLPQSDYTLDPCTVVHGLYNETRFSGEYPMIR